MPKTYRNIQNPNTRPRARELRAEQTPSETRLWRALRNRAAGGLKFRRQVPFGSYIVDFYCAEKKLVVEVDGGVHDPLRGQVRRWNTTPNALPGWRVTGCR